MIDLTGLIESIAAAGGGIAGGFVLSQNIERDQDRAHRIMAIAASGIIGHYVGYIFAKWAIDAYEWLHEGDFMVAGAAGFIAGAVIPSLYKLALKIIKKIEENPQEWIQFFVRMWKPRKPPE